MNGRYEGDPPLSLELICGASDAPEDHMGYWEPEGVLDVHPKHEELKRDLGRLGIRVDAWVHRQDGVAYSDAYVRFFPQEAEAVVDALRRVGYAGDILDVKGDLTEEGREHVFAVAEREGWVVE